MNEHFKNCFWSVMGLYAGFAVAGAIEKFAKTILAEKKQDEKSTEDEWEDSLG